MSAGHTVLNLNHGRPALDGNNQHSTTVSLMERAQQWKNTYEHAILYTINTHKLEVEGKISEYNRGKAGAKGC